jgi:hypothetical protein
MRLTLLLFCICTAVAQAILLPDTPNRLPAGFKRDHDELESRHIEQSVWNPCPELNVNCVLDGDWKNPVGSLGKKRKSLIYTIFFICLRFESHLSLIILLWMANAPLWFLASQLPVV